MKTFSKKELVEKAKPIFKGSTGNVLYATTDGQFFYNKNRAELHAGSQKKKLTVVPIEKSEIEPSASTGTISKENEGYTVNELEDLVKETSDLTQLENLLKEEVLGENRKTAVKVIQKRLKELSNPAE